MVLILQQVLPNYRYEVLRYLPSDSFKILYSDRVKDKSLKSVKAEENNFIEIPIFNVKKFYIQNVLSAISKYKPNTIVVSPELKNGTFWLLKVLQIFYKFRLVAWTHGINNVDFVKKSMSLSTRARLLMMRLTEGIILYSEGRKNMLKKYVSGPVLVANNTLDTNELNRVYTELNDIGNAAIKKELGVISGSINFIYVGRLIKGKKLIECIDLFNFISKTINKSCYFHIIGSGPEKENIKDYLKTNRIENVSLKGRIVEPYLLGKWLYISDMHLHLGYVGLAVVHSLCYGTPIITQKPTPEFGPYHSPEFEYLNNNNAVIDNLENLKSSIVNILKSKNELSRLKENSRLTFTSKCSIKPFLNAFLKLSTDSGTEIK